MTCFVGFVYVNTLTGKEGGERAGRPFCRHFARYVSLDYVVRLSDLAGPSIYEGWGE
jgi:hypothetical protein